MSEARRRENMDTTTISISDEVADRLYERKGRGESYNDVVLDLLERVEAGETAAHDGAEADTPETRADPAGDDTTALGAESAASVEDLVDAVADDVLPGSGEKLEARHAALLATVEYLREAGEATPSEFKSDVYPEHTARYETPRSWWKNAMYDGLVELAERTDAIGRADTSGDWSWRGHEGPKA